MEGQQDPDIPDRDRGPGGENSAAEGDGDRGRYSSIMRCASQSSLDESSQRPGAWEGAARAGGAHATKLLAQLAQLRQHAALCDVTLRAQPQSLPIGSELPEASCTSAEGQSGQTEQTGQIEPAGQPGPAGAGVRAHRAVLAACSPYFRAMFTQFEERTRSEITIQNIEPAALEAIVDYMYDPDSLVITEDNVQSLLSGASLLGECGVRAACCGFLSRALCADNALGIRAFADLHACADLAAAAAACARACAMQVFESEEFLSLEPDALAELLQSDHLVVSSEEVILDAVIRWMQHDPESRTRQLGAQLSHVRLPLLSRDTLLRRAHEEPLASAAADVKDLVIEALSFHLMRPERRAAAARPPCAAALCARARPRHPPREHKMLLVVGGQAPKAIRSVEARALDDVGGAGGGGGAAAGRWGRRADLPARRCRAGTAAVRGLVYAVGGFNGTLRVRSVDVYDVATDTWRAGPALVARRSTLGVCVLGDTLYAVGGFDGSTGLSSVEALDVSAGAGDAAWRGVAAMGSRRSSVGVGVLDGRLYAVGGYDGACRQCLSSVECYDPALDRWEAVESMSARRSGAGVGAAGGALYALGGHDGPAVRRSVERYRPGQGWSPAPPMASARRNAAVTVHAGRLYVAGGDDGAANLNTVEVFDPASEQWSVLAGGMSVGRSYAGLCVVHDARS